MKIAVNLANQNVVARATKFGSLYYFDCRADLRINVVQPEPELKEIMWHRHYGHLGVQGLQKLTRDNLVRGHGYKHSNDTTDFCEACIKGKHKKSPFQVHGSRRATELLDLVHSDVCGKLNTRSLGGAEYFVTFIHDYSHYTWVFMLRNKDGVFGQCLQWKALVEKISGKKLKVLRTDNGGKYASSRVKGFLKSEGI